LDEHGGNSSLLSDGGGQRQAKRRPLLWRGETGTRREYVAVLAAGAVGAALVLLAAGRPWVHALVVGTPGQARISPSARSVAPAVSGLGLLALASVVAVVATRRVGRLIVGSLAALAGLGILASVATTVLDPEGAVHDAAVAAAGLTSPTVDHVTVTGWPLVAAVGALLILFSGLCGVLLGSRWPVMSGRYERSPDTGVPTGPGRPGQHDRPGTSPASTERDRSASRPGDGPRRGGTGERHMWDALDRGEDPTD
jgi:uncharacterized membrane protein (TIGR02234 family)